MTNILVVTINSLQVPKIKKILLYEMKFLVPNYSCLKNPWLGGYRPQIPVLSVLNWICWTPPRTKFLGTPLVGGTPQSHRWSFVVDCATAGLNTAWNTESKVDTDRVHPHDVILITPSYDPQISKLQFSTFHLCLCITRIVTFTSWLLSVPQIAQYNNAVYNDTSGVPHAQ